MSDKTWEEAESAFNAADWVLHRLCDTLHGLRSRDHEFVIAETAVADMISRLMTIRNGAYSRREDDVEHDERLEEDAIEIQIDPMSEAGLKIVDNVHYRESSYTGETGEVFSYATFPAPEHLTWEELLEQVEEDIPEGKALLKERYPAQNRCVEIDGKDFYRFLVYNLRVSLMKGHNLLAEDRNGVSVEAVWCGLADGGGWIRVHDKEKSCGKNFKYFSELIGALEDLPEVVTLSVLQDKYGYD